MTRDAGRALKLVAGTVAAALLAVCAPSATARQSRAVAFHGPTSQGKHLEFRVTRGRVRGVTGEFSYTCTLGSTEVKRSGRAAIRSPLWIRNGRFHYRGPVIVRSHRTMIGHGRLRFRGRFSGSRTATGRVQLTLSLTDGWTCESGRVTFKLSARR